MTIVFYVQHKDIKYDTTVACKNNMYDMRQNQIMAYTVKAQVECWTLWHNDTTTYGTDSSAWGSSETSPPLKQWKEIAAPMPRSWLDEDGIAIKQQNWTTLTE